jgi:hypothetical protein
MSNEVSIVAAVANLRKVAHHHFPQDAEISGLSGPDLYRLLFIKKLQIATYRSGSDEHKMVIEIEDALRTYERALWPVSDQ